MTQARKQQNLASTERNVATPDWRSALRARERECWVALQQESDQVRQNLSNNATYVLDDAVHWMSAIPPASIHAIVTDPPYGGIEYEKTNHEKLRRGKGGVWRIPPSFDGARRKPVPRFTVLSKDERAQLHAFFGAIAYGALRALVPGGHVIIASNPLVSTLTFSAFEEAGFEKRGEIIRLVQTLRGGYRPKGAEEEFPDVSVMPRSCWEPWGVFRKPFSGTVAKNLKEWGAGGLRRNPSGGPVKDVIECSPTRGYEKKVAPHPSLKPQRFLRQVVYAALPAGIGIVYDPFAGSGSTLAAAEVCGYKSIGTDRDIDYYQMARHSFDALAEMPVKARNS